MTLGVAKENDAQSIHTIFSIKVGWGLRIYESNF
jgi:hypothetical protein